MKPRVTTAPPSPSPPPASPGNAFSPPTTSPSTRPAAPAEPSPDLRGTWALIRQIKRNLPRGALAYNVPTKLHPGETATIQLLVSPKGSVKKLREQVAAAGRRKGTTAQLSPVMTAVLTGQDVDIVLRGGEAERPLDPDGTTSWEWWVTPKRTGVLHLDLSLYAVVRLVGSDRHLLIKTKHLDIAISVGWPTKAKDFVSDNWQWLWGAIVAPLAVWFYRSRRTSGGDPQRTRAS